MPRKFCMVRNPAYAWAEMTRFFRVAFISGALPRIVFALDCRSPASLGIDKVGRQGFAIKSGMSARCGTATSFYRACGHLSSVIPSELRSMPVHSTGNQCRSPQKIWRHSVGAQRSVIQAPNESPIDRAIPRIYWRPWVYSSSVCKCSSISGASVPSCDSSCRYVL